LPGGYTISLTAYDGLDISRRDSAVLALPIELFPKDREAFSDVELCTSIQPSSNQNSIFYKNTFEVIPNPGRLFGIGLPVMYYYVEVYNLAGAASQSAMTVRASVFDAAGTQVLSRDKSKPRLHDASVEVGTMNLSALKGGTYVFRMSLVDSLQGVVTSTERKFFIYKPGMMLDSTVLATSDFLPGEYAFMTEAEIDREAAYTKYVLSDFERSQFDALTELKAKKQFLFDFWKRGEAGAAPGGSVTKKEYLRRIEMANQNFSSGMSDGWKTDRGRVYVVYGPYDEIERSPSSAESNPYEIWHYNSLQGGVIFVFVDRNGMGDYTLVHSTHRNEMHEDDWYQTYALKIR
ncbi:MAG TPA: GWxTD domain-containing protein, partial [Bacteroidota bacterium]|nr:GWxTD domain-containing protein [Bacteroidota bacterium]